MILEDLRVFPITSDGSLATRGPCTSLTWLQLQHIIFYTSKSDLQRCPACPTLPACNGISGCDGFGITKTQLDSICPAAGWSFQLTYRHTPSNVSTESTAHRRLLGIDDEDDVEINLDFNFIVFQILRV